MKGSEKAGAGNKPGSVIDNHSSGIAVTGYLKQPTREPVRNRRWATPKRPYWGRRALPCSPIWSCSGRGLPCRKLLPVARCALTAPFHPYQPKLAVYFLWHFPWAHAPQALPGALSEGARTFLHSELQRLSGQLRLSRLRILQDHHGRRAAICPFKRRTSPLTSRHHPPSTPGCARRAHSFFVRLAQP